MRPTDPKELKRKKQPAGRGQKPARPEGRVKAVVLAPVLGPQWLFLLLTPGPILGLAALLPLARERHSILGT